MKLTELLQRLDKHNIVVKENKVDDNGIRTVVVGCALPRMPYGEGRFVYSTLVFAVGEDDVSIEERDALKRRLHHLTTDIFGDDPEDSEADENKDDDIDASHLQSIIPKRK